MAKEHRPDQDRDAVREPAQEAAADDHAFDDGFDDGHAGRQLALAEGDQRAGGPERIFVPEDDRLANWEQLEKILAGIEDRSGLVPTVLKLDHLQRSTLALRFQEVALAASGREVLQIAGLVGASLDETIDAAVRCDPAPSASQLRVYLETVDMGTLSAALTEDRVARLRKLYPGAPSTIHPAMAFLDTGMLDNVALIRWWVEATPPSRIARGIVDGSENFGIWYAEGLNRLGDAGWAWVTACDLATVAIAPAAARGLATTTANPTARDHLTGLLAQLEPGDTAQEVASDKASKASLDLALAASPVNIAAVRVAVAEIGPGARSKVLGKTHRTQVAAAATVEDLDLIGRLLGLDAAGRIELALEAADASPASIAQIMGNAVPELTEVRTLHRRFPDAAPRELLPQAQKSLRVWCMTDEAMRRWYVATAEPEELLAFVGTYPDRTASLCQWMMNEPGGLDWIYQLGGGGAQDQDLRRLALHCPDPVIAQYLRERVIGDAAFAGGLDNSAPVPTDPVATGTGPERLDQAYSDNLSANEVTTRIAELSPEEAARVRGDRYELSVALAGSVDGAHMARTLVLLDVPLADALHALPREEFNGLGSYVRTRPTDEIVDVFGSQDLAELLRKRALGDPLTLAPVMHAPGVLGPALRGNPSLLDWLADTRDPLALLEILAQDGMVETAVRALKRQRGIVGRLPPGKGAPARIRDALGILIHAARGEVADDLRERRGLDWDEANLSPEARTQVECRQNTDGRLWEVLDALLFEDAVTPASLLAECHRLAADGPELVRKSEHSGVLHMLHGQVAQSPRVVFPLATYVDLLSTLRARQWLFEAEPAELLLRAAATDAAVLTRLVALLDADEGTTHGWLASLSAGGALAAVEHAALVTLRDRSHGAATARSLFRARFGADVASSYTRAETLALWNILEDLPDAHAQQGAIIKFTEFADDGDRTKGLYDNERGIALVDDLATEADTESYEQDALLSRQQILTGYGITEAELAARIGREFEEVNSDGQVLYKRIPAPANQFAHTVLHEVGHAVDDMLGNHTELVFGLAGWRQYDEGDFDQWARDLGGWDQIPEEDQLQIRAAWLSWMSSTTSSDGATTTVENLAGGDHPATSPKHKGAGVAALSADPLLWRNPPFRGGRAWMVNHLNQEFYSVPEKTATVAPSAYSMSAPAEFFAECYAEYYRAFNGSNAEAKGGRLPSWIKGWMDANVDQLTLNPKRMKEEE